MSRDSGDAMMTDDLSWRDFGDAMKQASVERRANNRASSAGILIEKGIAFEVKNSGAHLVVRHNGRIADFWPGTGKYSVRGTGKYRRGVFNLIAELSKEPT